MSNVIDLDFFQRFRIIFTLEENSFPEEDFYYLSSPSSFSTLKNIFPPRKLYYAFSKGNVMYLGLYS